MEKIARICWNTNNWKHPSGPEGKSHSSTSYEKRLGFGHEEWLLDETKTVDGYNYGFLQPINVPSRKHDNEVYNIHLFTIDPNGNRLYVGCLKNAIGVTEEESEQVYGYYEEHGWIQEMMNDLRSVGCRRRKFTSKNTFNIKFKFSEAKIYYSNKPVLRADSIGHRYNLMNVNGGLVFEHDKKGQVKTIDTSLIVRNQSAGEIIIDPVHRKIQSRLVSILKKQYKNIDVECKSESGGRQRLDLKGQLKSTDEWHIFEIKTESARQSIREAIGQLLEYAHYPADERATKLFIVGPEPPDDQDKAYMDTLRKTYALPIWFRWFSLTDNVLHEEI